MTQTQREECPPFDLNASPQVKMSFGDKVCGGGACLSRVSPHVTSQMPHFVAPAGNSAEGKTRSEHNPKLASDIKETKGKYISGDTHSSTYTHDCCSVRSGSNLDALECFLTESSSHVGETGVFL